MRIGKGGMAVNARARCKANRKPDARKELERSRRRSAVAKAAPLVMSGRTALEFVKLEAAGLPYSHIFHYLAPEWWALQDDDTKLKTINEWLGSAMVTREAVAFNGAAWHDLGQERRIELALDKHASQLAYLLYTHNPSDTEDKLTLEKIKDAREALFEMQRIAQGGEQGAFAHMIADLLAGKVEGQSELEPPREGVEGATTGTGVPLGASVPIEALDGIGIPTKHRN